MSDTLPHFYQRLTLSKEDALKLAAATHVICGIVDGEVRIKAKEEDFFDDLTLFEDEEDCE